MGSSWCDLEWRVPRRDLIDFLYHALGVPTKFLCHQAGCLREPLPGRGTLCSELSSSKNDVFQGDGHFFTHGAG